MKILDIHTNLHSVINGIASKNNISFEKLSEIINKNYDSGLKHLFNSLILAGLNRFDTTFIVEEFGKYEK